MRLRGYGGKQSETCRATTAQPWVNFTRLREVFKWLKHERFVSTVNRYRRREGICKDNRRIQGERHLGKQWYLPHRPVLYPNQPGKVRRVFNAASKYKDVCLNEKLPAEIDRNNY